MTDDKPTTLAEIAPSPFILIVSGASAVAVGLTRTYWPLPIQQSPEVQVGQITDPT